MALQKDYTINLDYVLTTDINVDDIEKNIQKQYVIKNAYFKVINISPIIYIPVQEENESESKNNISTIYLEVYDSKKTKVITIESITGFKPSNTDGAENIIKQAYEYLKTTELFKNSLNVLEEGQKI